MSGTARVINASDIATALGGPGAVGQVIGSDGTTPQWVTNPARQKALTAVTGSGSSILAAANSTINVITITETNGQTFVLTIGTSPGAADVLPATTITAGQLIAFPATSFNKIAFADATSLYFSSNAWNAASINVEAWFNT